MDTLLSVLVWILPLICLALAIDYGATFVLRSRINVRNPLLLPAVIVHATFLGLWWIRMGMLFDRLPTLELLGKMSWLALLGGFVLITITMLTGAILFRNAGATAHGGGLTSKVAAKIIIGSMAWLACLVAILGKYIGKWSPSTISRIAVAGAMIVASLFVISAMLS